MTAIVSAAGFENPVHEAQATFRAAMRAFAEPGLAQMVEPALLAPAPLQPATAALLLALADFETPIWLDPAALAVEGLADFLRFQTGAPIVADAGRAAFGVITEPAAFTGFAAFAQGTLDYPDRSTTLILQVETLSAEGPLELVGPGIASRRRLGIRPEIPGLASALSANHGMFPRGVDLLLVAGDTVVGLPRSTRVTEDAACM
ncbi:phosphonate C-P lyase system protein PhnH [Prosthecodimorpha staleyi]|uniref:Phosphonate C-P lyase system protein PhnH n=1 Tax=Prosthecodimorpha staleyi TaxID=2840188 RepID=A0A947GB23_9HYPH|nr:phosphonate C-P lyase system protein PhnH [Prosthecodimorpha staleyi]MBT9289773.1 phosphonate C-P lyase system protein PhnH [Prosthecodimorpha staleyi]